MVKILEGDKPLWLGDEAVPAADDAFGAALIVDPLAEVVVRARPPFAISLSGGWGIGKSTIAAFLREALERRNATVLKVAQVPVVIIDAWTEEVSSLRERIALEVAAALRSDGPDRTKAHKAAAEELDTILHASRAASTPPVAHIPSVGELKRRGGALLPIVALVAILAVMYVFAAANWGDLSLGKYVVPLLTLVLGAAVTWLVVQSGMFFHVETGSVSRTPPRESVALATWYRETVSGRDVAGDAPLAVLVIVDNLDRLPGSDALAALTEMRSLIEVDHSRCLFLVPIDRQALVMHLEKELGTAPERASGFLDKFFNLDLLVTRPEPVDLREWILAKAQTILPATDRNDLLVAVQVIASAVRTSPRAATRILNGVSTRLRILSGDGPCRLTLGQLAFVESLLATFPWLSPMIEADPRVLIEARDALAAQGDQNLRQMEVENALGLGAVPGGSMLDTAGLVGFLEVNADVTVTREDLRWVLALRPDRFWRGVPDPITVQDALDRGDATAFASILHSAPSDEQPRIAQRSVEWLQRSGHSFRRDAMTNLLAMSEVLREIEDAWDPGLHHKVVRIVMAATSDGAVLRRLNAAVAAYLIDGRAPSPELRAIASAIGRTASGVPTPLGAEFVRVVRIALPLMDDASVQSAGNGIERHAPESPDLEPLFEEPAAIALLTPLLATRMAEQLATWGISDDTSSGAILISRRLTACIAARGGSVNLEPIRAKLVADLAASAGRPIEAGGRAAIASLIEVLRGDAATANDPLAAALADSLPTPEMLSLALPLNMSEVALAQLVGRVDTLLSTQSTSPAAARLVLEPHLPGLRPQLARAVGSLPYAERLTARWIGDGDVEWAHLLVDLAGDDGLDAILAALRTAASMPSFPDRAREAIDLVSDAAEAKQLMTYLAQWCRHSPPELLGRLAPALFAARARGHDLSEVLGAIGDRLDAEGTGPGMDVLIDSIATLDEHGLREVRATAPHAAARALATSAASVRTALWIAKRAPGSEVARKVVIGAVGAASTEKEVVALSRATAGPLKHHGAVGLALVERAAKEPIDVAFALPVLRVVGDDAWKRPVSRDERVRYAAALDALGADSELTDAVVKLR